MPRTGYRKPSAVPIPQEAVVSWRCFQLTWPDTDEWFAVLLGLLQAVHRGRFWDETTGSVLSAIATGNEIWEQNFPVGLCEMNVTDVTVDCEENKLVVWKSEEQTPLDISCLIPASAVTNIRIVNAVLQIYQGGYWVDISGDTFEETVVNLIEENVMDCEAFRICLADLLEGSSDDPPPATWPDELLEPGIDQACLIAHGMRAVCVQARDDIEDELTAGLLTISGILGVAAAIFLFSGVGAPGALLLGCVSAAFLAGAGSLDLAVTDVELDEFACIVYCEILLNAGVVNNALIEAIQTRINSAFPDYLTNEFFTSCVNACGKVGMKNVVLAYNITDDDCSECEPCSEEIFLVPRWFGDKSPTQFATYVGDGWWVVGTGAEAINGSWEMSIKDSANRCFRIVDSMDCSGFPVEFAGIAPCTGEGFDPGHACSDFEQGNIRFFGTGDTRWPTSLKILVELDE
jgi:hypothetical protein